MSIWAPIPHLTTDNAGATQIHSKSIVRAIHGLVPETGTERYRLLPRLIPYVRNAIQMMERGDASVNQDSMEWALYVPALILSSFPVGSRH